MIYFVQESGTFRIKIGFTSDLEKRLSGIRSGCPHAITVLATTPGGRRREAALHKKFARYRRRGEWFVPGPRLLTYVIRHATAFRRVPTGAPEQFAGRIQQAVLAILREAPGGCQAPEIATRLNEKNNSVRYALWRMMASGAVRRHGRQWFYQENLPAKSTKALAAEWLVERFAERLEWPSKELFDLARLAGVGRDAIFRAKDTLGVPKARKVSMPDGEVRWVWWVPDDWEHLPDEGPVAE